MQLTEKEWQERLTPEQYKVLREKGTEPPFTGEYVNNHKNGSYSCAACGAVLFTSDKKFDSNSGWPSFYDVAREGAVSLVEDNSHGMSRLEAQCTNCGSHLGHVFNDAYDQPTGQRFCINSLSLQFKDKENKSQESSK